MAAPLTALAGWARPGEGPRLELVGDGALAYAAAFESALGARVRVMTPVPALSPAVAVLAARAARAGLAVPPGGVRPLYVRRPDAELARERREKQAR